MKRALTVSLVALFLSSALSNVAVGRNAIADPVQTIRQQYAAINKGLARYKKVKKELSGFSLEGGNLTAYLDGPTVVKIVVNHYGEGGKATEEYYYSKGKLIFVYRKDYRYDKPMSGKVVRTAENRFYFENDRLIRWINEAGKQVASGSAESQQKQDEYLQTSNKFLNGVRSKDLTIEA
jgi:hypothetical protein